MKYLVATGRARWQRVNLAPMHVFVTVLHMAPRMAQVFLRSCETLHIGLCYMTCVLYYPDAVGIMTHSDVGLLIF